MADKTQATTNEAIGDAKGILKGIKGAGDAIRGTFNESVDTAFKDTRGEAKNKAIKEKGQADMQRADERVGNVKYYSVAGRVCADELATGGTTTGAGAHSGGVGNMSSTLPQENLGSEPTASGQRY